MKARLFALAPVLVAASFVLAGASAPVATDRAPLAVSAVDTVGFTVSDMDRATAFYTGVLTFVKVSDEQHAGRSYELLTGVFGARSRVVRLRLGSEVIELTEFLAPRGRPVPADLRANDQLFQHIAVVVRDLPAAYARLREHGVEHASSGPQRLPDWNPKAGGIDAFYFRDPDRHFLEVISFPEGKRDARWQDQRGQRSQADAGSLFLGIDHTAIVVSDTDRSIGFYRDTLGFAVAGESENYDTEQEHLNNVFGARLRITTLRARQGPGVELLEYLAPRDGRAAPPDLHANDIAHWQTTMVVEKGLDALLPAARAHRIALVSPGAVTLAADAHATRFREGALARDPDGHAVRLVVE
jgi:catechol 2,3-dioxygenase-like lactoylglutathione lyase family enzyme